MSYIILGYKIDRIIIVKFSLYTNGEIVSCFYVFVNSYILFLDKIIQIKKPASSSGVDAHQPHSVKSLPEFQLYLLVKDSIYHKNFL